MKLRYPAKITSRLLPGVDVNKTSISIEYAGKTLDNRQVYRYFIDLPSETIDGPGIEHESTDLSSGVGGGGLQSGLANLLGFLAAAGESYRYFNGMGDEDSNARLFPEEISQWASENEDELSMICMELDDTPNLIEE